MLFKGGHVSVVSENRLAIHNVWHIFIRAHLFHNANSFRHNVPLVSAVTRETDVQLLIITLQTCLQRSLCHNWWSHFQGMEWIIHIALACLTLIVAGRIGKFNHWFGSYGLGVTYLAIRFGSYWSSNKAVLTHWGRDKMAAFCQTTFSNAFSSLKMYKFWLKFHWRLFLRLQLAIFQHWFR